MGIYDSVPQTGLSAFLWGLGDQVAQARQANAEANAVSNQPQQQGILAKLLGFGAPDQQPGAPMQLQGATPAPQQPPASGGIFGVLGGGNGGSQQPPANALPYAPTDPNVPGHMIQVGNTVMSPKTAGIQQDGSPHTGDANPYGSQPATTPSLFPAGQGPVPAFAAGQGQPTGLLSTPGIANLFTAQEQRNGLPAGYLSRTAQIESNGNPNAVNKGSGAAGLFQFIPSTAAQYGLSDPTNVGAATNAAAQLASDNANVLRNALGRDPTGGELYLAHQQGASGAAQLLANPNARAGDIVGDKAVRANGGDPNMTAGQFASLWTSKYGQGGLAGGGIGGSPAPLRMLAAGGGSPYGGLNPNAFNGQQGGQQGPILAQPGMGGSIPSGGGFAPQQSVGNAYSASGQQVPTDANGNALDANGQPTALAYGAQVGAGAAPAARAITGAIGGGQPYGSVPLNVNGRMMTRDQAEANNGTDHTDYDDAAAKAGLIPNADAAPAYGMQGTVPTGRAPSQPTLAPQPAGSAQPQQQATNATPLVGGTPMSLSSPSTQAVLANLLRNPDTNALGKQIWGAMLNRAPVQFQHFEQNGSIYAFNPATGSAQLLSQGNAAPVVVNKSLVNPQTGAVVYDGNTPDTRTVMPSEYPKYGIPAGAPGPVQVDGDGKLLFPMKQGQSINIDQKAETSSEAAFGKAQGDEFGSILKAGAAARGTQGQLALMNDAFQQSNGQIATGPFAKSILGAKQAILGVTGIDLGGVPESEAVQKLGFGLATTLTKEISQRPAQQEFLKALENVPGIFMSPQGSRVMMSVLNQQAQQKIDLAGLVSDRGNRQNWPAVEQAYYDTHPLLSPFTGKPLSVNDVSALTGAAQQAGIDPTTGQPASGATAPPAGVPSNARQGTDGNFYVPDPNRAGKFLRVN